MEKAKCPECQAIIDHLRIKEYGTDYVSEYVTRYGTSDLNGEDVEIEDSNTDDSNCSDSDTEETHYYCTECEKELSLDDLETVDEGEAGNGPAPKPNPSRENSDFVENASFRCFKNLVFFVCARCETKVEVLGNDDGSFNGKGKHGEREVKCTKCNRRLTAKNAKQIIKV